MKMFWQLEVTASKKKKTERRDEQLLYIVFVVNENGIRWGVTDTWVVHIFSLFLFPSNDYRDIGMGWL